MKGTLFQSLSKFVKKRSGSSKIEYGVYIHAYYT